MERNKKIATILILYVWPTVCLSMASIIASIGCENPGEAMMMAVIIGGIQVTGSLGIMAIYVRTHEQKEGVDGECK